MILLYEIEYFKNVQLKVDFYLPLLAITLITQIMTIFRMIFPAIFFFLLISCDEGDPEPFAPEERIVSLSIISPDIENIKLGEPVEIIASLKVNVRPIEQAEISFFNSKGDVTYNGVTISSGEKIDLDTSQEIKFIYVSKTSDDSSTEAQRHTFQVLMTGCENSPRVRPNCSADAVKFKTID